MAVFSGNVNDFNGFMYSVGIICILCRSLCIVHILLYAACSVTQIIIGCLINFVASVGSLAETEQCLFLILSKYNETVLAHLAAQKQSSFAMMLYSTSVLAHILKLVTVHSLKST